MNDETLASNGIDVELALEFVRRIEALQAEIDELAEKYKAEAEPIREDIAAVKREAVDAGIGKRELSAVLKRLRLERQAERAAEHLDIEQRSNFLQMIEALERAGEMLGGSLGDYAKAQANQARG